MCGATRLNYSPCTLKTGHGGSHYSGDEVEQIIEFDPLTGEKYNQVWMLCVYANTHYITPGPTIAQAITKIKENENGSRNLMRKANC